MNHPNRSVLIQMAPVLLAVAILGYFLGASRSSARAPSQSAVLVGRTGVSSPVVLEYPAAPGWLAAPRASGIPGLAIKQPLVLGPNGDARRAGLIAGQISSGGSSPLPTQFLAHLREIPKAEVVSLLNTQAYRYPQLLPLGSHDKLTLYAIPDVSGTTTTIVCYTELTAPGSSYLKACEQLVGKLTLQVEAQSEILLPNAAYAHEISDLVGGLDKLRIALRAGMGSRAPLATLSGLAKRLADGFTATSRSLSAIQPPTAAAWAQVGFSGTLSQARDAYLALANAARTKNPASYEAARKRASDAEAQMARALEQYALAGYN